MKCKLKIAAHLGGKDLKPGVHVIPGLDKNHWFVAALIKNGSIELLEESKKVVEAISEDESFSEEEPLLSDEPEKPKHKGKGKHKG